jgi:UTP--glucose-1-phosphate uridylyltransferase
VYPIHGMVEKPKPGTEPSDLAILGRYILQPEIFDVLSRQEKGAGGEIQLTDAMLALIESEPFHAVKTEGLVYDCGSTVGFLTANAAFALARSDLSAIVKAEFGKLIGGA